MPMSLTSSNTDLKTAIIHNPLTIAPTAPLTEVIGLIIENGYILVLDDRRLVGIVTNHNLVKYYATVQNLAELSVADVMISPVVTLPYQEYTDVQVPFNLLHSHQIEHLPLVDNEGAVVGLLKHSNLLQLINLTEIGCSIETPEKKIARLEAEKIALIQTHQVEMSQLVAERRQATIALEQLNHALEIEVAGRTAELQASQEFIQKIADASPNILYLYDLQENQNIYANRELTDLLGYTPEQLQDLGSRFVQDLIHPDDQSQLQRLPTHFEKLTIHQDDEILECEYRMRDINGDWRWLSSREAVFSRDAQGRVKQLIGTAQDISERKRLEQEQSRLISILEASTDYIGMADTQGNVIWTNTKGRQIHGLSNLDVAISFRHFSACYPAWALKIIREEGLPAAIATGSWFGETALLDATGQEIPTAQMIMAHKSPQGEVELFSTILRDIRATKEYEHRLERSNADLIRATRLKDEFLATMSHELRTPLNSILGMSESLEEEIYGPISEQQRQSIATINRSGHHLLEMINDILEMSNLTGGQIELKITNVEINELCQSSWSVVAQRALPKRLPIVMNIATGLGEIAIDRRRIQQVLINLLGNAIKFTPEHGQITLDVYLEKPINDPQQFICFAITDTGIGIAAADLPQLFQPFVQIDRNLNRQYEGTGLGLALVKQIVELHDGGVSVQSELGQGSCFAFKLPLIADH
jgi:PAS domain S-box-containing protein